MGSVEGNHRSGVALAKAIEREMSIPHLCSKLQLQHGPVCPLYLPTVVWCCWL